MEQSIYFVLFESPLVIFGAYQKVDHSRFYTYILVITMFNCLFSLLPKVKPIFCRWPKINLRKVKTLKNGFFFHRFNSFLFLQIFEAYQIKGREHFEGLLTLVSSSSGGTYAIISFSLLRTPLTGSNDLKINKVFPINTSFKLTTGRC